MKNNLWFKAKYCGWGWYPVTWQGWLCVGSFLAIILLDMFLFRNAIENSAEVILFIARLLGYTIILLAITFLKGEAPKWRWGK